MNILLRNSFWAFLLIIIDRLTKTFALTSLQVPYHLMPGLSAELVLNRGVTWGFLDDLSPRSLVVLIASVFCLLCWHAYLHYRQDRVVQLPYLLIGVAALSNIYDRLVYGAVIDFIHIHYGIFSWPVFNIADIAIVSAVFALIWSYE